MKNTKNIHQIFEDKKLEAEFQNEEPPEGQDEFTMIVDQYKFATKRLKTLTFQAEQLENRLRKIQKDFYDDMRIIDSDYKGYDGEIFPWHAPHTKSKYMWWNLFHNHLDIKNPILEVAIRIEGNDKENGPIDVLHNICSRIRHLEEMAGIARERMTNLKKLFRTIHGKVLTDF